MRKNKRLCLNSECVEHTWTAGPDMHFQTSCRFDRNPLRDINIYTV